MIIMRVRSLIPLIIVLCLSSAACAIPLMPTEFYGTVSIDGTPAPAGTNITSLIDGQVSGFAIVEVPGVLGGTGPFDQRLPAYGTADGQVVSFSINGVPAATTAEFHPGTTGMVNLVTGIAPAPTTGSSTTPAPAISPAPTEKPVIDDVNDPEDVDPTLRSSASYQARTVSDSARTGTIQQPAAAVTNPPANPQANPPRSVSTKVPVAESPARITEPAESDGDITMPVYAIFGGLIVIVIAFAGYSYIRRRTRWQ